MSDFSSWQEALVEAWQQVQLSFLSSVPTIIGSILIFTVGLILAYWVKRLIKQFLQAVKMERLSKTLGIDQYLKKASIEKDSTELLATLAEWIVMLVFFLAVVDILGLDTVSSVLTQILGYIPNIVAAVLILVVGYFVAKLVDGIVRGAIASVDTVIARPLGQLARWLIIVVSFFAAIDQLQIAQTLIATFFQGLTYTIVLVVGLSIGLGSKDLVARLLNDWYERVNK